MDVVNNIIAWEEGELDARETIEFFAHLIQTGQAWTLQGVYGRTAQSLIDNGYISKDGTILSFPE